MWKPLWGKVYEGAGKGEYGVVGEKEVDDIERRDRMEGVGLKDLGGGGSVLSV